jgi:hydrogenase nickel incorporation protein HypA/HybF
MHEFSLVRALLEQIAQLASREHASRATGISLSVGEFSGVDADLLQLAFAQSSEGTMAQDATLTIRRVPLEARCPSCQTEFPVVGYRFQCPVCDASEVVVVRGEELILETVTLERAER